jgi:uncharacterized membrane protein YjgN (DUF898 family)
LKRPRRRRQTARAFLGNERAFWRLLIRGAALLFVTLGIYRFWLATDVRRFLWSNTEIAGDGLEYIGTARELLLGFLIAIALLVPLNVVFFLSAFGRGWLSQISGLLALIVLALLGQFAVYRARRYRLTRTVYRGIRFHQTGSAWRYAVCAIFWWAMIGVTLGLAYPFAQAASSASSCAIPIMAICRATSSDRVCDFSFGASCCGSSWSCRSCSVCSLRLVRSTGARSSEAAAI